MDNTIFTIIASIPFVLLVLFLCKKYWQSRSITKNREEKIAENITCEKCNKPSQGKSKMKMNFLGFQIYTCPECGYKTTYPLSSSYFGIYRLVVVIAVFGFIFSLASGQFYIPGLLLIAAIVGLIKNSQLRKKLKISKQTI